VDRAICPWLSQVMDVVVIEVAVIRGRAAGEHDAWP
jgi:hypothetical protein